MNFKNENGVLTVFFDGRIDSNNAINIETELKDIISKESHSSLVLDAEKLVYLSSAGLRVILRTKKDEKDIKMVNVTSDVYDVLDMTGFTEMMTIEKAYRVISVDNCEVVGQGANGKVYRIDSDTIVKVYIDPNCLDDMKRERDLAHIAFVSGVPTAIPYDIVKVGDSFGSVFELLNSKSFVKGIISNPENIDKYIDDYVSLMKIIHSTEVHSELVPNMKDIALDWAKFLDGRIPQEYYDKLISMISAVPEKSTLLHGDYHVKNVMMQGDEPLLIDMDTLCYGDPIFELGSMFNAYKGFSVLDKNQVMNFLGISYETADYIWKRSVSLYFDTTDEAKIDLIEKKASVVGYTRLLRRSLRRDTDPKLVEAFKNGLLTSIDAVDDLLL